MQINTKRLLIFFTTILMLSSVSCQSHMIINSTKYENLNLEKRQEVDGYLLDAKKMLSKKDDEIILMFQYNCFLGQKISINNTYTKDFPKTNKIHYGQSIVNFPKKIGKIKINMSNGKSFSISQKKDYDYITICHNEKTGNIYIHYYDFPKILVEE
ncbi:hypothetical protein [Chryseobacterium sp. CT-SW4]|uniref:hypothetical protein n=1 Tax=Chryseobacterium sp. SW-1 TaxID=3157343 RepID=UPI003B02AFD5